MRNVGSLYTLNPSPELVDHYISEYLSNDDSKHRQAAHLLSYWVTSGNFSGIRQAVISLGKRLENESLETEPLNPSDEKSFSMGIENEQIPILPRLRFLSALKLHGEYLISLFHGSMRPEWVNYDSFYNFYSVYEKSQVEIIFNAYEKASKDRLPEAFWGMAEIAMLTKKRNHYSVGYLVSAFSITRMKPAQEIAEWLQTAANLGYAEAAVSLGYFLCDLYQDYSDMRHGIDLGTRPLDYMKHNRELHSSSPDLTLQDVLNFIMKGESVLYTFNQDTEFPALEGRTFVSFSRVNSETHAKSYPISDTATMKTSVTNLSKTFFKKAADQGHPEAFLALNQKEKAAELNYPQALFLIGNYQAAADLGHPRAFIGLAKDEQNSDRQYELYKQGLFLGRLSYSEYQDILKLSTARKDNVISASCLVMSRMLPEADTAKKFRLTREETLPFINFFWQTLLKNNIHLSSIYLFLNPSNIDLLVANCKTITNPLILKDILNPDHFVSRLLRVAPENLDILSYFKVKLRTGLWKSPLEEVQAHADAIEKEQEQENNSQPG